MTDRERFVDCMLGRTVDRPPYCLFWGPWGRAWERWQREGKPADITDHRSFMCPDQPPLALPVKCGPCPDFPHQTLSEDEKSFTWQDSWGIIRRNPKANESMSEFLKFPVSNRAEWESYKAERLDPKNPERLAGNWLQAAQEWTERGWPIQLGNYPDASVYGGLRWLMGDEECLYVFYDDPELVHEIMNHLTDIMLATWHPVVKAGVRMDVIHIWEDMAGKSGPLISPTHWREFMGPCYRRIAEFAADYGIPLISVDTDGKPDDIVAPMMENGVNYLYPVEVAAGCDVNDYRRRWPQLALMGGIDKRALALDPAAIDAELDRVWPAVQTGRYIPDLDHLVPDDVSWENYVYYCEQLKARVMG
jgi:hypothetical protein